MAKFIILTNKGGKRIWVNSDNIKTIEEYKDCTQINFSEEFYIQVKEVAQDIISDINI